MFLQQFFCDKSSRYGGADLGLALAEKVRKEYNKIKNKQRGKNRLKDSIGGVYGQSFVE